MKKLIIGLAASVLLSNGTVQAHHSFSATFTDETISVEGVVESLRFVNPHVLVNFSVTDDNGKVTTWVSEGSAATSMRRNGWSNDTVKEGDYIRITGNSTRNGSPMVSMGTLEFVDPGTGEVTRTAGAASQDEYASAEAEAVTSIPMTFDGGIPNLSGAWLQIRTNRGNANGAMGGGAMAMGGMGRARGPAPPGGIAEEPAYTEAAAAQQAVFDAINDPQVQCEPPGLVRQAAFTPHPVRIVQNADHVVISYEEYGGVRTVYFDERDLLGGEHTHLGQSSAHYEDDKLIIESSHLKANLTGSSGYALSDKTTTVETYYRIKDEDGRSVLAMDMTINDPGTLTKQWAMSWNKGYSGNYDFIDVECEKPLTN